MTRARLFGDWWTPGEALGRCLGMGLEFIVDERTAVGNIQIKN